MTFLVVPTLQNNVFIIIKLDEVFTVLVRLNCIGFPSVFDDPDPTFGCIVYILIVSTVY